MSSLSPTFQSRSYFNPFRRSESACSGKAGEVAEGGESLEYVPHYLQSYVRLFSSQIAACAVVALTALPAGIEPCVFCDVWSGKRPWTDALNPMNLFAKNGMTPRREKVASSRRVLPPPPKFGNMKLNNNMRLEDYDYGLGLGLGLSDYDYDYSLGNVGLGRNGKVGKGKGKGGLGVGVGTGGGRGGRRRGASKSSKKPSALYDLYDYENIYSMDDYYDDYEVGGKGGQVFDSDINVPGTPNSPSWNGKKHENPTKIWPTWAQHSSKPNMFQNLQGHLQTTAAGAGSARSGGVGEDASAALVGLGNSARGMDVPFQKLPTTATASGLGNDYRSGGSGGGNGGLTFRKGNEPSGGGGVNGESRFRGSGFDTSGLANGSNISRMRRLQQQQRLLQQQQQQQQRQRRLTHQRQRQRGKPGCQSCGGGGLFSAASNTHEVRAETPLWHDGAVASASEDASLEDAVASASEDHGLRRRRQNDAGDRNGWRAQTVTAAAAADGYSRAPRPTTSCVCRCDCCPCCPCDSGADTDFIYVDEE